MGFKTTEDVYALLSTWFWKGQFNKVCIYAISLCKQTWFLLLYVYNILTPKSVCAIVALVEIIQSVLEIEVENDKRLLTWLDNMRSKKLT